MRGHIHKFSYMYRLVTKYFILIFIFQLFLYWYFLDFQRKSRNRNFCMSFKAPITRSRLSRNSGVTVINFIGVELRIRIKYTIHYRAIFWHTNLFSCDKCYSRLLGYNKIGRGCLGENFLLIFIKVVPDSVRVKWQACPVQAVGPER